VTTQQIYAVLGLTAIVAVLVGIITFALLKFVAAARQTHQPLRPTGETALLSIALQEAVAKVRAQEQAMTARAEASERLSAQIVSSLTAGLLVADHNGIVQILNPAARRLLHIEDAPLGPLRTLLASAEPLADAVEEGLRTDRPLVRRSLQMHGGRLHLGVTTSPFGTPEGEHGVICLFSDLTSVVELENQLRLKETLAQLGELTAGIAHEFRNGLATIHGYARLMDPQALPEAYRPYMNGIRGETEALGKVMTNFLNFAKPDQVVFTPVDFDALAARVVDEIRADSSADITLRGTFGALEGDDVLLRQMLINLIRNGIEAARDAGQRPAIVVEGQVDDAHRVMRLTVEDNGPGIETSIRDRIFRPFFTTKAAGTGLGLAIVQKIVVTHNGRIALRAAPGGASFEVTFPLTNQ
jgi:two-component system, NtrC family, sensor histidine kinase AtoS